MVARKPDGVNLNVGNNIPPSVIGGPPSTSPNAGGTAPTSNNVTRLLGAIKGFPLSRTPGLRPILESAIEGDLGIRPSHGNDGNPIANI